MISEDSPYGPGTLTLDTQTGLRWLDITLSRAYGYQQVLDATAPGGYFAGYRLATQGEVLTLAEDAGIDTGSLDTFTAANYAPVTNLMDLLGGPLEHTGNMGDGTLFDFTQGWDTPPSGFPLGDPWYPGIGLAASQVHLTGRLDIWGNDGGGAPGWDGVGAWLVQDTTTPEPSAAGLLAGGLLALALGLVHRRCRSEA